MNATGTTTTYMTVELMVGTIDSPLMKEDQQEVLNALGRNAVYAREAQDVAASLFERGWELEWSGPLESDGYTDLIYRFIKRDFASSGEAEREVLACVSPRAILVVNLSWYEDGQEQYGTCVEDLR